MGCLRSGQPHLPFPIHIDAEELPSISRIGQRLHQDTGDSGEMNVMGTRQPPEDRDDQQEAGHPGGGRVARQTGDKTTVPLGPEKRFPGLDRHGAVVDDSTDTVQSDPDQIGLPHGCTTGGDKQIHRRKGFPEHVLDGVEGVGDWGEDPDLRP